MPIKRAIIIGAGPAGLTAAYELLTKTNVEPVVLEKSHYMGGISRTVNHNGNRMDIGGHRFFSKSDRIMKWWLDMLPLQSNGNGSGHSTTIKYHQKEHRVESNGAGPDPCQTECVMLLRPRKSRIYYLRRFFDYPITLSKDTVLKLGLWRTFRIGLSYMRSALFLQKQEDTLEDFFINRFGKQLYQTFFKSYTEKVWGVPCDQISAEWGAQRIKGLSLWATVMHALKGIFKFGSPDLQQKNTETSLIEQFLYPKYGPGQMWEEVSRRVKDKGGEIRTNWRVDKIVVEDRRVRAVEATNVATGVTERIEGDYFFSTAPIQELMRSFSEAPPKNVMEVSEGLVYRSFITVGLLVKTTAIKEMTDNWIYIQEPDVLLGRLQIFNNWSPFLVRDPATTWLGLEYFCNEHDALWNLTDGAMTELAIEELTKIGIIDANAVLDSVVLRMEKTYPAYFGTYNRFAELREYVDQFENLFLVGRNGMHRYNNQDHSMLTAMKAVESIIAGRHDKNDLWEVNTEMEYHEESAK